MAVYSPTTHKDVVGSSLNPADDIRVDGRDKLTKLMLDMGLFSIVPGNNPPSNKDELWYHTDVRAVKRWDPVGGNWFPATPNQIAMHIARRAVLGSVTEVNIETGDLFTFWDASLGETKIISRDNLMAALGAVRTLTTNEGVQGGGTLGANRTIKLDLNGLTTKPLPAGVDVVGIYSVADAAHRKSTVEQIAAGISASDYLHSEMYLLGMM